MSIGPTRPYADAAWTYRNAGWLGVLPVGRRPLQKTPPAKGYTGWAGIDPSGADVQAWVDGPEGERNLGLHIPHGVYVLDVDVYGDKDGAKGITEAEERLGIALPRTWSSTARGAGSLSRQYFFLAELPAGRLWRDHPVPGTESLHVGHRYALVWPSLNPDADGARYVWYDPDGVECLIPSISLLTELPSAWIEEFSISGVALEGSAAGDQETREVIGKFRAVEPGGSTCGRVTALLGRELDRLSGKGEHEGRSIHDAGKLHPLVCYGLEGHAGVREALERHHTEYVRVRVAERGETRDFASADWWRQVCGSVGKKLLTSGGEILEMCGCDVAVSLATSQPPPGADQGQSQEPSPGTDIVVSEVDEVDEVDALIAEMLSLDEIKDRPAPRYLIKGLLNLDSESWLIGAPGSKKSFAALDMACHVARGDPWQGFAVTQAVVIVIAAEGAGGLGRRVRAWERAHGPLPADVHVLPRPVQAANGPAWKVLERACARLLAGRDGLVVIDTQARVTVGLKENDATDMGFYISAVGDIRRATGACVLTVHHTGRNGGDARGSSAIDGAQDTELKIKSTGKLSCSLSVEKQKDLEELDPIDLVFKRVVVGVDEDGDDVASLALCSDPYEIADGAPAVEIAAGTALRVREPEEWTFEIFSHNRQGVKRQILQALRDLAGKSGRTESQIRTSVAERWYGGRIGRKAGELNEQTWAEAWTAAVDVVLADGEQLVTNVRGEKWILNQTFAASLDTVPELS